MPTTPSPCFDQIPDELKNITRDVDEWWWSLGARICYNAIMMMKKNKTPRQVPCWNVHSGSTFSRIPDHQKPLMPTNWSLETRWLVRTLQKASLLTVAPHLKSPLKMSEEKCTWHQVGLASVKYHFIIRFFFSGWNLTWCSEAAWRWSFFSFDTTKAELLWKTSRK